jgi:hypothetical protein
MHAHKTKDTQSEGQIQYCQGKREVFHQVTLIIIFLGK